MAASIPDPLPPMPSMNPYRLWQLVRRPAEFMQWAVRTHGDPYLVKLAGPMGSMTFTGDPEAIQAIFSADPDLFEPFDHELLGPFLGPGSVLLMSGARHKAERKLLMPPFHGARMRAYGEQIREASLRHMAAIPLERPFSMQDLTHAITLEVMIRAVLGITGLEQVLSMHEAITAKMHALSPWVVYGWSIQRYFGPFGPWIRFRQAQARVLQRLTEEIEARDASPLQGQDILSLLLQARYEDGTPMSRAHVRDELVSLLFAGHETTAIVLAWAFYRLHRHDEIRRRLMAELEPLGPAPDPEAVARLPYLDAVVNETLRLYPVVPLVPRRLRGPLTLKGYHLPAGMGLGAAIPLAHTNPSSYPDPHEFRPERFLGRSYSPFEFLPYGGGARRCVGAAFAEYEMKLVLSTLLPRFELELVSGTPERMVRRSLSMGPQRGVQMRVRARSGAVTPGGA